MTWNEGWVLLVPGLVEYDLNESHHLTHSFPPPTEAGPRSGKLPEGAVAAGRGRGRVGVELSEGEGEGVLFPWAYPPRRAAQTTSATASSASSRSPRGELTPGALGD